MLLQSTAGPRRSSSNQVTPYAEVGADTFARERFVPTTSGVAPVAAACSAVTKAGTTPIPAMTASDRKYGVLAEGSLHGWHDAGGAAEITQDAFCESTWAAAREALDANRTEETS
ncbi:hypothetical protein [Streptomyces sp. NPDC054887]